ncbi:MAG: DUF1549 and DUF1553 domain-containing protein [Planctomycetota bacterium]
MPRATDKATAETIRTCSVSAVNYIVFVVLWLSTPVAAEERPWAYRPIESRVPDGNGHTLIDAFLEAKRAEHGLPMAQPAARSVLMRRLSVDLHGLVPMRDGVRAFEEDSRPDAYERLVDRLLASPRYGERSARLWMDAIHFAETHGHDEDAIRPNAWPYRDYLIESFNADKPYARFVREQLAGDILFPDDPRATVATAFNAVGPWDESSQMGIQDGTLDKTIARYMDRDDMLTTAMSTFTSTSVHCARCHDHKFDPITQDDYYALQSVFAGVDRVDRPYEVDPNVSRRRRELTATLAGLGSKGVDDARWNDPTFREQVTRWAGDLRLGRGGWRVVQLASIAAQKSTWKELPDRSVLFGGQPGPTEVYRFGLEAKDRVTGLRLEVLTHPSLPKNGPGRAANGNLHLSEIRVFATPLDGSLERREVKLSTPKADFNQGGWTIAMSVDRKPATAWGVHPNEGSSHAAVFPFAEAVSHPSGLRLEVELDQFHPAHIIGRPRLSITSRADVPDPLAPLSDELKDLALIDPAKRSVEDSKRLATIFETERVRRELAALPAPRSVYAIATDFAPIGNFKPAKGPRPVHVLKRGDVRSPLRAATPGALTSVVELSGRFEGADKSEGARRAAFADWIVHPKNPLSWRSVVNRAWQQHFGRGLVATPNEFGELGAKPSHPGLLDRLAFEFRERGGSLKWLHREIVLSAAYRQSSTQPASESKDPDNVWLARFPLRRLDAETMRDSALALARQVDWRMGGPSVRQFHTSKGVHITPVVDYRSFAPERPENRRRSVYRFVFRTVPDPFFRALDCPDASQLSPTRSESVTVAQALALRHHRLMIWLSERVAEGFVDSSPRDTVRSLFETWLLRAPSESEEELCVEYVKKHGVANLQRWIVNLNEFVFVR